MIENGQGERETDSDTEEESAIMMRERSERCFKRRCV